MPRVLVKHAANVCVRAPAQVCECVGVCLCVYVRCIREDTTGGVQGVLPPVLASCGTRSRFGGQINTSITWTAES